jgi:hypothetical protein
VATKLTLVAVTLALAATGDAAAGVLPGETLAAEAQLAAKHPGLFTRSGKTLRIGKNEFTDAGSCMDNDPDCVFFRADTVYGGYVGVWTQYYEQSDYMLVDPQSEWTTIGGKPVSSPSGKRFFVLYEDPTLWTPLDGAAVWNWAGPERLRVVDKGLVEVERFVAWRGESCVELIGRRRYPDPYKPMWLAEQEGDWRLTHTRPPICTG